MNWNYKENQMTCLDEKEDIIAQVDYIKKDDNTIDIEHVYVSPEYRGKGVAEQTMQRVVDFLKEHNLKAMASCSYANHWFQKNENQYADVMAEGLKSQAAACRIDGKH